MRISYKYDCVTLTTHLSKIVGTAHFIGGQYVEVTEASSIGKRADPGCAFVYVFKIIEVETNHDLWQQDETRKK